VSLRRAHGHGRGALVRVETSPVDELPLGVQAPTEESARHERRADGTFARGARTAQAAGGRATRGKSRLAARLGLSSLPSDAAIRPYMASAATFRRTQCAELARTVGGGVCGPGPASIVASAALALAWSRYFSDVAATTGDPELAMRAVRLGDSSRQMLLTAHELCAREALSRSRQPIDPEAWSRMLADAGRPRER
jgi:hypothetical protein